MKRQWKGALETLLINNACPNHATQKGATPLMMASSRCDTDAVKILLKFQADICYEDQVLDHIVCSEKHKRYCV